MPHGADMLIRFAEGCAMLWVVWAIGRSFRHDTR